MDADIIGLAVYQRYANNQPGFDIVVHRMKDGTLIRMLKALIRNMTNINPQNRWAANRIKTELDKVSTLYGY